MVAFTPEFIRRLEVAVREMSDLEAQNRQVFVTDEARAFLVGIVVESVIYRGDEWSKSHPSVVLSDPQMAMIAVNAVRPSLQQLLSNAIEVTANGGRYICVISFVQAIQSKWCGVWPFCR